MNDKRSIETVAVTIARATFDHYERLAGGYFGGAITALVATDVRGATVAEFAALGGTFLVAGVALAAVQFGRRTLLGDPAAPLAARPRRRPQLRTSDPMLRRQHHRKRPPRGADTQRGLMP